MFEAVGLVAPPPLVGPCRVNRSQKILTRGPHESEK